MGAGKGLPVGGKEALGLGDAMVALKATKLDTLKWLKRSVLC